MKIIFKKLYQIYEKTPRPIKFTWVIITSIYFLLNFYAKDWVNIKYLFFKPDINVVLRPEVRNQKFSYQEFYSYQLMVYNNSDIQVGSLRLQTIHLNYEGRETINNYTRILSRMDTSYYDIETLPPRSLSQPRSFDISCPRVGKDTIFFYFRSLEDTSVIKSQIEVIDVYQNLE